MTSHIHSLSSVGNTVYGSQGQEWDAVQIPSKLDAVVQPSVSSLSQAVDGLNKALQVVTTHLRFRLHEDTHRYYVEIVDTLQNEVIREVPPKRFLDMVADMYQFIGIVVDEKR